MSYVDCAGPAGATARIITVKPCTPGRSNAQVWKTRWSM